MPTRLGEAAEELLHTLITLEEKGQGELRADDPDARRQADRLVQAGYVMIGADGRLDLTVSGRAAATQIVRRHRLAERLLVDVLDLEGKRAHDTACRFEHILRPDVEERICTLLGHPRGCPHGQPIPPGRCCREAAKELKRVVSPVSDLEAGEGGAIAYLHSSDPGKMNKFLATGMLPGQPVKLLRSFPSYVLQVGNTQYAVDREMAEAIYVRLADGK